MLKTLTCTAVAVALLCASAASAAALGSSAVLLGFGGTYELDGLDCTHHGIDIGMPPRSPVEVPAEGVVAFAGRVPVRGGGSTFAVSVDCEEGRVSLLPLEDVAVTVGQKVVAGSVVGALSKTGDPSSGKSHLHLGLRREGEYIDPAFLLAPVPEGADAQPVPDSEGCPLPELPAAVTVAPAAPTVPAPAAGSVLPAGSAVARVRVAVAAPGVLVGVAGQTDSLGTVPAPLAEPAAEPAVGVSVVGAPAAETAMASPPPVLTPAVPLLPAPLAAGAVLLVCVGIAERMRDGEIVDLSAMSDRFASMLQHPRTGDTLCGLNSCSGHAAFTVPGPSAQRR